MNSSYCGLRERTLALSAPNQLVSQLELLSSSGSLRGMGRQLAGGRIEALAGLFESGETSAPDDILSSVSPQPLIPTPSPEVFVT